MFICYSVFFCFLSSVHYVFSYRFFMYYLYFISFLLSVFNRQLKICVIFDL